MIENSSFQNQILNEASVFLTKAFSQFAGLNFKLENHWHIDHLCYRTASDEQYNKLKNSFAQFSELLIESEVNGRLISTFKLFQPVTFYEWEIDLIEVPAPKLGKKTIDGFEHFEIVCDLTFGEIKNKYSGSKFEESGLNKDFNQELELIFDGFAIKFHHLSLESLINIEKNELLMSAIKKSNVLNALKPFSPLVAGTFPLGIISKNSDVDILVSSKDLGLIKETILKNFNFLPEFICTEKSKNALPSIVCSFIYEGFKFEIFAQALPTVQQQAYLHFLAEERILKFAGKKFADKIKHLRTSGLKTEATFVKLLDLEGDPYETILALQKVSNLQIKDLVCNHIN